MSYKITVLSGDGVGPDVIEQAVKVLKAVEKRFGHSFELSEGLIGGVAIDKTGSALTEETLQNCRESDAVLLGAVGDPKYDDPQAPVHPEDGLLALRKGLGLFANLRPVKVYPSLIDNTNIKPEALEGVDFIFLRELTGGLYFGQPKKQWETEKGRIAVDSMLYTEQEIARIVRVGFELARKRGKKLLSVDKANVLLSSRLWRQVTMEVSKEYPDVELSHMLIDACAMQIIRNPKSFDVAVTENTFGDIITDEASMLAGSLGMLPSASLAGVPEDGVKTFGLYEPVHGSAPDIKGQDKANPIATILSVAMMLRYSFGLSEEAAVIEKAVEDVLEEGIATADIAKEGTKHVGTIEMGSIIAEKVGA